MSKIDVFKNTGSMVSNITGHNWLQILGVVVSIFLQD